MFATVRRHDGGVQDQRLTAHGRILEAARESLIPPVSKREAARRAGISDARWRQIVTGVMSAGRGQTVDVNTTESTLARMARAVGADAEDVLTAAGFTATDAPERVLSPLQAASDQELLAEIQRRFNRRA